ncbi:MAG: hypothetical protein AAGH99_05660 [Planctomycetota bacterium]
MSDPPADPVRPLHVSGTVNVEADGHAFTVEAQGERIAIDLPSVAAMRSLLQNPGDKNLLNLLTGQLQQNDLDLVIQLKGQPVATLGKSADPGAFEKVFKLEGVDISFRDLARVWFKRRQD